MYLTTTTATALALAGTACCQTYGQVNTTQEYQLRTCVKPGQENKTRFENLWLDSYHTGAGMSDVTFQSERANYTARGFLNSTGSGIDNDNYQEFDLGTEFPWSMAMADDVNFYAAWQPVRIDAGAGSNDSSYGIQNGFFINDTGLQWSSSPGNAGTPQDLFGGWLVCEWWHEVPQLFFRNIYYNNTYRPCSCADVWLIPEYI